MITNLIMELIVVFGKIFIVVLGFATFFYFLSLLTYLPIPIFSYIDGRDKISGRVVTIKKLKGGMTVEVCLNQDRLVNPRFKDVFSRFIYFRRWQKLPEMGDVIEVDIVVRVYKIRDKSLNWVKSWRRKEEKIFQGKTISLANHHDLKFTHS